jgi:hypothetical protein
MIFKEKYLWEDKTVEQEIFKLKEYKNFSNKKTDRKKHWYKSIRTKKIHYQLKL